MPTRKQEPEGRQFRQDAFASSSQFESGVLGNLVAARCQLLADREEIAMLWWLQRISWREGGLEKFAEQLLEEFGSEVGTASMRVYGTQPGRVYTADEVKVVRGELYRCTSRAVARFPLRGELVLSGQIQDPDLNYSEVAEAHRRAPNHPENYPAASFMAECHVTSCALADHFRQHLVDPAAVSLRQALRNFPALWSVLERIRSREVAAGRSQIVETEVTRQVHEALDYAFESRGFVLVEGREGIGKSEAVRSWCAQHPGQAVYVSLEAGSDETTLYRSIARAVGTACSYQRKAVEMRTRIQDALQHGHLMLVLDEAHFLWPMSGRSERASPKRVDWLRTALIESRVPVALVSTPQFFERQCERFRRSGWNANQIQRRLAHTTRLPDTLSNADALAVARWYFPLMSAAEVKRIAGVAILTIGYLTTISHLRKRVDFFAKRSTGESESQLVEKALGEILPDISKPAPAAPRTSFARPAPKDPEGVADRSAAPLQVSRMDVATPFSPASQRSVNRVETQLCVPS